MINNIQKYDKNSIKKMMLITVYLKIYLYIITLLIKEIKLKNSI